MGRRDNREGLERGRRGKGRRRGGEKERMIILHKTHEGKKKFTISVQI